MRPPHWAQIAEVTSVTGIKLLFGVYRMVGRWPLRVLLYPTMLYYVLRHPSASASSRQYLTRLFRLTHPQGRSVSVWLSVRHFASFAEGILDRLRIWAGSVRADEFIIHGHDAIDVKLAAGTGGVIVVAHLGNADMCRALTIGRPGLAMTVIVHTKHAESFNALLAEINPASTFNLLQVSDLNAETAIRLQERVERGEFIVIAGDRIPVSAKPRVVAASFLGDEAEFPVGPYVLASLLKCPTFLLFCVSERGVHHVYFELFRERTELPRSTRDGALKQLATDYAARLTHYCQRAPLQWFNFYDFWAMSHTSSTDVAS